MSKLFPLTRLALVPGGEFITWCSHLLCGSIQLTAQVTGENIKVVYEEWLAQTVLSLCLMKAGRKATNGWWWVGVFILKSLFYNRITDNGVMAVVAMSTAANTLMERFLCARPRAVFPIYLLCISFISQQLKEVGSIIVSTVQLKTLRLTKSATFPRSSTWWQSRSGLKLRQPEPRRFTFNHAEFSAMATILQYKCEKIK